MKQADRERGGATLLQLLLAFTTSRPTRWTYACIPAEQRGDGT